MTPRNNNQDWVNHISTGTHFAKRGGVPPQTGGSPPKPGVITTRKVANSLFQNSYLPENAKKRGSRKVPKMAKKGQKRGKKGQIQLCRISSSHGNLRCISLPGSTRFVGWSVGWGIVIVQNSPPSEKKIVLIPTSSNFKILLALY